MDLAHWVERSAAFTPDKLAIRFAGDDLNYAAFAERIRRTGSRLAALGVGRGDLVAYLGRNHPEMLALLFACARCGAIVVPLNWRHAAPEHARVLADCSPRAILVDATFTDARTRAARRSSRHDLDDVGRCARGLDQPGTILHVTPATESRRSHRQQPRRPGAGLLHVRVDRRAERRRADAERAVLECTQQHAHARSDQRRPGADHAAVVPRRRAQYPDIAGIPRRRQRHFARAIRSAGGHRGDRARAHHADGAGSGSAHGDDGSPALAASRSVQPAHDHDRLDHRVGILRPARERSRTAAGASLRFDRNLPDRGLCARRECRPQGRRRRPAGAALRGPRRRRARTKTLRRARTAKSSCADRT